MCLSPVKILNPSRWLAPNSGQQLYMYVPCGHCWQCRSQRQNEWRIRSYYECFHTIENGGYMLFDTLTYSDNFLPHCSDYIDVPGELDFSCFSSRDIQLFFKRLRKRLSKVYDVKNKLRYFLVCEYGSENFTFRPHYHVFFFVKDKSLSPLFLSQCISYSWQLGRTDGLPFRSPSYVKNHNTFSNLDLSTKKCVLYVSKYVSKDFQFMDKVRDRLYRLMSFFYTDFSWQMSREQKAFYNSLVSFVVPFHRQSLHFGESYIDYIGRDKILQDGFIKFNFNGIPSVYGLFPSLKRKLFYNLSRKDGNLQFHLNGTGIEYRVRFAMQSVDSLSLLVSNYNLNNNIPLKFNVFNAVFNHYRLLGSPVVSRQDIRKLIVDSSSVYEYNGYRNYSALDFDFMHQQVLTLRDHGSKKDGFSRLIDFTKDDLVIPLKEFERFALFYSDIEDGLFKLYEWTKNLNKNKLAVARHNERLKKIYKNLKLC